jgi:hypothetical protein
MTRSFRGAGLWLLFGCAVGTVIVAPPPAPASDHADPIDALRSGDDDDRGLTDLFAFPVNKEGKRVLNPKDGDALVLILCANRLLAKPPPYRGLDGFEFFIHIDTARAVEINHPKELWKPQTTKERDTARYGGIVTKHEEIEPTFTLAMKLRNELSGFGPTNFTQMTVRRDTGEGPKEASDAERAKLVRRWGAGLRDDPFIFPAFFGTNVIAMLVEVPYSSFPPGTETFILWGVANRHGKQTDIQGRSQRTQLPRFDLLNTIPPREHVAAIRAARENPGVRTDVLRYLFPAEFNFRQFDNQPDVMIFTKNHPVGFPNGRRLEDDVAKLTCEQGDCQLYELSFVRPRNPEEERNGKYEAGRPTANDRPFREDWPYLGDPWEQPNPQPPPASLTTRTKVIFGTVAALVFAVFLLPWVLYFRAKHQLRRVRAAAVALGPPVQPPPPTAPVSLGAQPPAPPVPVPTGPEGAEP